ncbi:hypothetical protein AVEN_218283-1 [Araneus ventricosus]|uniref:Uncharacterized protein n=1 Tax=Araneus ventricosus TaxID=182803 RepID=A0A4Y2IT70_ARAVE|nr:hypothetical protein AVEN_218283-1 [Araneus ventricosus]
METIRHKLRQPGYRLVDVRVSNIEDSKLPNQTQDGLGTFLIRHFHSRNTADVVSAPFSLKVQGLAVHFMDPRVWTSESPNVD